MQGPHFPTPITALLLVIGAWLATLLAMLIGVSLAVDPSDPVASIDPGFQWIAQALGFGLVATLAARRLPGPQAERIGLVPLRSRYWLIVAMGVPAAIVASELDNWLATLLPSEDPEAFRAALEQLRDLSSLAIAQAAIFQLGIEPVVTEFLFRGVIQQGMIAYLGRFGGVTVTAVLSVALPSALAVNSSAGATVIISLLLGFCLGYLRVGTGSLLAPILVRAAWNAMALFGIVFADDFPVPGFNTFGEHTDPVLFSACLACVVWGGLELTRAAAQQPVVLPIVEEPEPESEDDEGGFF